MEPNKKQRKINLNAFLWKIDPDELKNQVDNYNTLPVWRSYRKQIVLVMLFLLGISFLVIHYAGDQVGGLTISDFIYGLIIYLPVLFFVYRGHRWAMVTLIIIWTIEKVFTIVLSGGSGVVGSLFYWYIVVGFLLKAIQIENAKFKIKNK